MNFSRAVGDVHGAAHAAPFVGPSLVLTGRQDSECGYLDAWDLLEDLPHATFAVLDRAGHAVAEERQPLFRALVDDWLDRIERAQHAVGP